MPLSLVATTILTSVDWNKIFKNLATDAAGKGTKNLLARLQPDDREKSAKAAVKIFVEEFTQELEDKLPAPALPGFQDDLKRLIESAAPDIAAFLQPEIKKLDLGPVERMWNGLGLNPLPEDFDWTLVAGNLTRALKGYVNRTPELRDQLLVALIDRQTEFQARLAGPDPGFDLSGYREFLRRKCGLLQLSAMHTSAYDRRIGLWSVFVPQSARESIPVRDLPRDLLRRWAARQELARGWKDDPEVRKMLAGHS